MLYFRALSALSAIDLTHSAKYTQCALICAIIQKASYKFYKDSPKTQSESLFVFANSIHT